MSGIRGFRTLLQNLLLLDSFFPVCSWHSAEPCLQAYATNKITNTKVRFEIETLIFVLLKFGLCRDLLSVEVAASSALEDHEGLSSRSLFQLPFLLPLDFKAENIEEQKTLEPEREKQNPYLIELKR